MDLRIHIFCGTSNLCKLISKSFEKERYLFDCTEVKDKSLSEISNEIDYRPDCIIVDKDIDSINRDLIIRKFPNCTIVLLPSLDETDAKTYEKNVFQISEPFKLSELREVLNEIYYSKSK